MPFKSALFSHSIDSAMVSNIRDWIYVDQALKQKTISDFYKRKELTTDSVLAKLIYPKELYKPTYALYVMAYFAFALFRRKYKLTYVSLLPICLVPYTIDSLRREYYRRQNKPLYDEAKKKRGLAWDLVKKRVAFVSFGQVWQYLFKIDFKSENDLKKLIPPFIE